MHLCRIAVVVVLVCLSLTAGLSGQTTKGPAGDGAEGIAFVGMFRSEADLIATRTTCQVIRDTFDGSGRAHDVVGERPAMCDKIRTVITGDDATTTAIPKPPVRVTKLVTDSQQRIVVLEPTTRSIHIFDFNRRKYVRIDGGGELVHPSAVAVDGDDNIYVTDLSRGLIAVYSAKGKFKKYIGNFKDGETAFEEPNSIAIDRRTGRIYLTEGSRNFLRILDRDGKNVASIGKRGGGKGRAEFRFPTDVVLHGQEVFVLDKRNERIQVLDLDGRYKREFTVERLGPETARGMAMDKAGVIYLPSEDGLIMAVDQGGQQLFHFGHYGAEAGEFRSVRGIYIDAADRVYVGDTGNERVQVFQITNRARRAMTAEAP